MGFYGSFVTFARDWRALVKIVTFALLSIALSTSIASAQTARRLSGTKPDATVHFSDGSIAVTYYHCGDTDLCSRITEANGSVLSIYSEGAAKCQPYLLHFVKTNSAGRTQFEFTRAINHSVQGRWGGCGESLATEMVLDRGYIHLLVTENTDGTLDLTYSVAKT